MQQSAKIYITNSTDGSGWMLLFHNNSSNGTQQGNWNAGPGQTVGPLTVYFETGLGSYDYSGLLVGAAACSGRTDPRFLCQ
jgi:phospholipase C